MTDDVAIVLRFIAILEQRATWRRDTHHPDGEGDHITPEHARSGLEVYGEQNAADHLNNRGGFYAMGNGCYHKRKHLG